MDHFSHAISSDKPATPMAHIVEKFLIDKLNEDIKKAKGMNLSNWRSLFLVHDECEKIKTLIEEMKFETRGAPVRREKLYYLLNIMAEWLQLLEKQRCQDQVRVACGDDFRRRLKQIEKDLKETLKEERQEGAAAADKEFYRWSSHAVDIAKIHGFDHKRQTMERLLLREGSKVIGIVGVAGVGKTALCQVAFNDGEVQKHFLLRIWLCLSRQQEPFADDDAEGFLVKRVLRFLGFDDDEVITKVCQGGGLEKLKAALKRQLKRGRFLMVLDDVLKVEEGDDEKMGEAIRNFVSFLIEDPSLDGSVIVTSRFKEVEKTLRRNDLQQLKLLPLADKECCWKIFIDAVVVKNKLEDYKKLKDEILENIHGLPLMAKMLGESSPFQKDPETTVGN